MLPFCNNISLTNTINDWLKRSHKISLSRARTAAPTTRAMRFSAEVTGVSYTRIFKNPHRMKSVGDKSEDHGGQAIGSPLPSHRLKNSQFRHSKEMRELYAVNSVRCIPRKSRNNDRIVLREEGMTRLVTLQLCLPIHLCWTVIAPHALM